MFKMFIRFKKFSFQIIIFIIFETIAIETNGKVVDLNIFPHLIELIYFILEAPSLLKQLSRLSSAKGSDVVLNCNVAKGTKPFRFQWHKNNVEISDNKHSRIEFKDIYSLLTLYNIDREDIGNYSCIVTNQFGFDRISFQLDVTGLNFY